VRAGKERVHGPYQHGKRWRVVLVRADGERLVESFASETEAARFAADAREQAEGRTVAMTVDGYLRAMRDRGLRPSTIDRASYHLRRLLGLDVNGGRPLRWLVRRGPDLYARSLIDASVDTHRNGLAAGRSFGRWCVERRLLPVDPFATCKPLGRRKRGKDQLRVDEARRLSAKCLELAAAGDEAAIATLAVLLLGLRASEATGRLVRDVDDAGARFVVAESKTAAGVRSIEVPAVLRPLLLRLASGRPASAPLFRDEAGEQPSRYWIGYHVTRLCRLAQVPEVCPQSLRGLHASLATSQGQTARAVADALGHETPEITKASYIDPAVASAERQRAAFTVLAGGRS